MPFGIGHSPPTHQLQSTCVGEGSRVPNLQTEFNYLDWFKSYGIFSDFVVPTWSLSSSRHPRCPHIVPIIPTLSLSSPSSSCCPHSPQEVPMWSPWSVVFTCCPCCPHIVPTSSLSSSCCPHSPQKVPMWSPWSVVSTCCPHRPRHPHVVLIIPTSSRRSPHHPQPPKYPVHPAPTPVGGWGPWIS